MNTIIVNDQILTPSKVVCIGRNYAKHIAELNNEVPSEIVVFMKPNSAISTNLLSHHQEALHYEGELSFVVKNGQFAAVGFGLDLTKRGLQSTLKGQGLPWERAKAFDGAAVFDQFVLLPENVNLNELSLELYIDEKLIQKGGVEEMMYPPKTILKELAQFTTLCDGDIVMTGTPEGVGVVQQGACFRGRVLLADAVILESRWIAS